MFVAAWRHIVTLFRGQGADNVTWLWTINAGRARHRARSPDWWPGAQYVTWVGIDGYYYRPSDTFATVFGRTITPGADRSPTSPSCCPRPRSGRSAGQFAKISDLFDGMRQYKTLGLVWFDIAQNDGILHQDWRIEDSRAAEAAFQLGVSALNLIRS